MLPQAATTRPADPVASDVAPAPAATPGDSWQDLPSRIEERGHYLDDFLGALKRDAYLRLIDRWADCRGRRVLKTDLFEEAVGPDAFLDRLAADADLAVGVDLSVAVARRAHRRFSGKGVLCLAGDVRHLPFRPGCFDRVVSPSTLDHFAESGDLRVSLLELRRLTATGGRAIVTLDNRQNVFDPLLRLVSRLGLVPYFLGRSYTAGELAVALGTAGFTVLDTTAIVHNPRLVAAGTVALANRLGWRVLTHAVRGTLTWFQRFEGTRMGWRTGCFVAALATPDPESAPSP